MLVLGTYDAVKGDERTSVGILKHLSLFYFKRLLSKLTPAFKTVLMVVEAEFIKSLH